MKKSSNNKQLNFFSQPELLFLQFDPKKCNDSQGLNLKCSPDNDFDVCTQPIKQTELRTGKKSWRPPTIQCFSSNKCEIMDTNISSLKLANDLIDNISSDITNNIKDEAEDSDLFVLTDKNSELDLSQDMKNTLKEENNLKETKSKNDETSEQHLSTKSEYENYNCVSDIKSYNEEETHEDNNDMFGLMEVNEIDELIDKKIEDHFSTECEIEFRKSHPNVNVKNQVFSNRIDGITSDDSEDEFNLIVNNANELNKLDENKMLQEDEDRLLESSQSPPIDRNVFKNDTSENNKPLQNVLAENLLTTTIETIEDKEENEFDLTITNSQLLQIEQEYSKNSVQAKCSESSTQTVPISELRSSMEYYPQMVGGMKKIKNDIQKIRQCVEELKKIK